MLAPIAIFTYNRTYETKEAIKFLKKSRLASETELFIFSDGPKTEEQKTTVFQLRNFLKTVDGFKKIELVFYEKNKGLANSIIDGVTKIVNEYGKIIVLEDDLLVSEDFLEYMNEALDTYEKREDIWSISGFAPKIEIPSNYKEDVYLIKRGCSWGWGTWKDRWNENDWTMKDFEDFKRDKKAIKEFNKAGNDMFKMLELQKLGKINSWAIRWCYNQFNLNKWTVYPMKSKIKNIGFGDNATHGGVFTEKHIVNLNQEKLKLNPKIKENEDMRIAFKKHNDLTFYGRVGYFLKKYDLGYKMAKKIMRAIVK